MKFYQSPHEPRRMISTAHLNGAYPQWIVKRHEYVLKSNLLVSTTQKVAESNVYEFLLDIMICMVSHFSGTIFYFTKST